MEFYFSDKSFFKDKFLQSQKDEDGYISMSQIMAFNKMKQIGADINVVASALESRPLTNVDFDKKRMMVRKRQWSYLTN